MSILLSAYFPEGIVFAADKNVTLVDLTGEDNDVEVGAATKVIPWPRRRAVVGYCGLGELNHLDVDEWMRQFVASTRDFEDLGGVAREMRELIQRDFDRDYPEGTDISENRLIIHLGGFRYENDIPIPAMYLISNVGYNSTIGEYGDARRDFRGPEDNMARDLRGHPAAEWKTRIEEFYRGGDLFWYNNGIGVPAFNAFKGHLWNALREVRAEGVMGLAATPSLEDRVAYCKMAVELFGSFFRHHFQPRQRFVGGGVDAEWVPWPET